MFKVRVTHLIEMARVSGYGVKYVNGVYAHATGQPTLFAAFPAAPSKQ